MLIERHTGRCSIIIPVPILNYHRLNCSRVDCLMYLMHVKWGVTDPLRRLINIPANISSVSTTFFVWLVNWCESALSELAQCFLRIVLFVFEDEGMGLAFRLLFARGAIWLFWDRVAVTNYHVLVDWFRKFGFGSV